MISLTTTSVTTAVIGLLVALLLGSVWSDFRNYKIPNKLILAGISIALLANSLLPEGNGFASSLPGGLGFFPSLAGLAVGFLMLLPLYLLRGMGAGDVKLVAMIGAFLGVNTVIGIVLLTFIIGGILAIIVVIKNKSFGRLIDNLRLMIMTNHFKITLKEAPTFDIKIMSAGRLPYAIPIALGTFLYIYLIYKYPNISMLFFNF